MCNITWARPEGSPGWERPSTLLRVPVQFQDRRVKIKDERRSPLLRRVWSAAGWTHPGQRQQPPRGRQRRRGRHRSQRATTKALPKVRAASHCSPIEALQPYWPRVTVHVFLLRLEAKAPWAASLIKWLRPSQQLWGCLDTLMFSWIHGWSLRPHPKDILALIGRSVADPIPCTLAAG